MKDERLSSELERRARSAELPLDWPRTVLLPGVNAAIDSRSAPVRSSRLAPLAGIAGIAAVLIVLVVALPRLGPGQSQPTFGSAPLSATQRAGDFSLTITAARSQYGVGEPIEVEASLLYDGGEPVKTVGGSGTLLGFGIEQQNRSLRMDPDWTADCAQHELVAGVPWTSPFSKSGGFSNDDPDAEFWRAYLTDPQLRLPAGVWRIFAAVQFGLEGCATQVELSVSISIRVDAVASASPIPPATPLPTVTPRAAPSVAESPAPMTHILCPPVRGSLGDVAPTVVDFTGLVDACVASSPIDDGGRIVRNPDGDQTVLQVDWSGDSCDAAATLSLKRVESRYLLDITPAPGGCRQLYATYSIQLRLRGTIDADDVVVTYSEPGGSGLGSAWWELAADERPTDASADISLVVHEAGCASGQSPEGRVEGPTIAYSGTEVVITFTVRPPPGTGQTCPSAPGVPVSVHLAEPLGKRALVDGTFGPVTLERADDFLALSSGRVDETARERLQALAGPDACISNIQYDRYVPTQAELETWAADLGPGSGFVPVGSTPPQAYLGDWLEAAHAFGAIEAFEGRPKPWYIITSEPPMNRNVPGGTFTLVSLDPFPVSGGRTIWFAGFYQATTAAPGACRR